MSFKVYLTEGTVTNSARAETLDGALAVAKAFEVQHFNDRDCSTAVWSNAKGGYVQQWRGGVQFGPKDTRHPMLAMLQAAKRAGCRVYVTELREGELGLAPVTRISPTRVAA